MCLAIPLKVRAIKNKKIFVEKADRKKEINGSLIKVKAGDFVFLKDNFIVGKILKKEAEEIINLIKGGKNNVRS